MASNDMHDRLLPIARFCAPYSTVGALFMYIVALLIAKQPFYLLGLDDFEQSRENALGSMWLFIAIVLISTAYMGYESSTQRNYDLVETGNSPNLPRGMSSYNYYSDNPDVELTPIRGSGSFDNDDDILDDLREFS